MKKAKTPVKGVKTKKKGDENPVEMLVEQTGINSFF